jgi:diguanylate cyclase (GGDEF)-like protein
MASRLLVILAISSWAILNTKPLENDAIAVWVIALNFALHLQAYVLLKRYSSIPTESIYKYTFGLDILLITTLVYFTGGLESNFYLLYYLVIGFSAYCLGMQGGLIVAFISTLSYLFVNLDQLSLEWMVSIAIRLSIAWFAASAIGIFSKHMLHSGNKLLHLLDTLNERTTELERTQIQLETIYETSRSLGEIHNLDEVYVEITKIVDNILGYPMCSILLFDKPYKYLDMVAMVTNGNREIYNEPVRIGLSGITGNAIETGKVIRIADLQNNKKYIIGLKNARSEMAVPMITRGRIIGVLNAESTKLSAFNDRDEKLFTTLAASAGMAIENARLHKWISDLTVIDDLTGIYNYRYFTQRLEEEKKRASRYNLPLSLIMLDLDWFKQTNDTYGHEIGNIVLKEIVQVVKSCIRDTDTFCRYGGEEFIIILPQTGSAEASVLGERIRREVDHYDFGKATSILGLHITVSLGTTSFPDNGLSTMELVQTVDMALYRAKGGGKNRVCTV